MISRIRNKYLRRSALILSAPLVAILLVIYNFGLGLLSSYDEYTEAFARAWKGRKQ
ncbi:hypothetical protein [Brucella sp. NBRC 12950]|uniref:hypothetical protein n=1 Tax=Brucella sp. NBRC 12950 TaxID=2994518 RepID=UPI0024A1E7B1|nr:hypothetical protein [Brucella sp. NBRC 12950]GLU26674.1 hypothetical protein Brsp01_19070 [Brucella sp. NBRC 12950]